MDRSLELKINRVIEEMKKERLSELTRITGSSEKEITKTLIRDLLSLPGNQGSDERQMAKDWFLRGSIVGGYEGFENSASFLLNLSDPTLVELEQMAKALVIERDFGL